MNQIVLFLVIYFSIPIFVSILFLVKRIHFKKLLPEIIDANSFFNSIFNIHRSSTEEDVNEYINRFKILFLRASNIANSLFIAKKNKKNEDLVTFINNYIRIQEKQDFFNLRFTKISHINFVFDKAYSLYECYTTDHYFSYSECEFYKSDYKQLFEDLQFCMDNKLNDSLISEYGEDSFCKWMDFFANIDEIRTSNNQSFVTNQLESCKSYFDNLLAYPLDRQQRESIIKLEDNCLVISSAGSGKTSTTIAKARYLIDKRNIDPTKILILTYTRKAARELVERLGDDKIECTTFHSLAVRILAKYNNLMPTICEPSLLLNVFRSLLRDNENFLKAILEYILHLQSLMELEHEYESAVDYFADRKKYGIQAHYLDFQGNIIFTKSEEEKRICTYLTELGIDFLYEQPYQYNVATQDYRQYKPDFTIFVKDTVVNPITGLNEEKIRKVYLEHFAIDINGNVPRWFGDNDKKYDWDYHNEMYKNGIDWKRNTHNHYGTTLIETRSADFHSGEIRNVLERELRKANIPINHLGPKELYEKVVHCSPEIENSVLKLLEQFIALLKSNCSPLEQFINQAIEDNDYRTQVILSNIVKPLLEAYTNKLRARQEIDYTDAILKATTCCNNQAWNDYYYILVDEFQDISIDRYKFLNALRAKNPLTKLFCVGDDWQSIYRFAGSNMRLFYRYEEYFGYTEHCKIEKTYRFFDPLLRLSSDFIQKNPEQMKKDVVSNAMPLSVQPIAKNSNEVYRNESYLNFYNCGKSHVKNSMLRHVTSIIQKIPQNESILILGRYNYDVRSLGYDLDAHNFDRNRKRINLNIANRTVQFMSVHTAKGLEADNVILINCNEGIYGFPSLVEDDPILSYLLSDEGQYEYAEERRLYYVAITRARYNMYVLYNEDKPSPFVRELTNILEPGQHLCPVCQNGHVVVIKHSTATNGTPYTTFGCSNANAGCVYFERVFGDDIPYYKQFQHENEKNHDILK